MIINPLVNGDTIPAAWRRMNSTIEAAMQLQADVVDLREALAGLKSDRTLSPSFFPFKIYRVPSRMFATPDVTKDWRTVRVRAGMLVGVNVTGTDGANADPDSASIPAGTTGNIECPADSAKYYLWINATTGAIAHGLTDYSTDADYMMIGWVDTETKKATRQLIIRQIIRADVLTVPCLY